MSTKFPSKVNITSSTFYISDHTYYRLYKGPYKNMKILIPYDYDIDIYHVYGGHDAPVTKYQKEV